MEPVIGLVTAWGQDDPSDAKRELLDEGWTEFKRAQAAEEKGDRAQEQRHFRNAVRAFDKAIRSGLDGDLCRTIIKRSGEDVWWRMTTCSDGRTRSMARSFLLLAHIESPLSVEKIVVMGDEGELERTALVCASLCLVVLELVLGHPRWWRAELLLRATPLSWVPFPIKYRRAAEPDEP